MEPNWRANRAGTDLGEAPSLRIRRADDSVPIRQKARPLRPGGLCAPQAPPQETAREERTPDGEPPTGPPPYRPQGSRGGSTATGALPARVGPSQPAAQEPAPTVGATIRARREALGLTLEALAEAARCAKSYLSEVERGRRPAPGEALLTRLEQALDLTPGALVERGRWEHAPPTLRRQLARLASERRAAGRLAALVSTGAAPSLDDAWRSGELARLVQRLAPDPESPTPGATCPADRMLPHEVPLINAVAAGIPTDEFTDLGYPARVADEYVRCAPLDDPDAFAARVVGDSMTPQYREGDIVVFSPARPIRSGMDCFARLEPDNETTFKRAFFETAADGRQYIRLQPLNAAYAARTLPREDVAGLYAAVSVTREL